mmetsp:Transcript_16955/g.31690  ORF Transcript_16955/g.31690 Transcript_16955/m.31690 type:complete len:186 (-) Transcript_16955:173-730(-)|eukprot:CAMPEP_0197448922 /NCGR_PEP_ID=MMETSP1175-20131217/19585_1 /TAXON_ID=1003142 /ORGANISM="Triceratium dubium, Strain CCMP147" /LENGTH=185 /DNA_ID=CAMNT_0042980861 /DNA_START=204 /DNA_END=761 /DNA_ORIENTATION=+
MGSCQSVPPPNPSLVGLWVSDDATDVPALLHDLKYECYAFPYKCAKGRNYRPFFRPCHGAALEIDDIGHMCYIEMRGRVATEVYSGPITDWGASSSVGSGSAAGVTTTGWTGCLGGCTHFVAMVEPDPSGGVTALTVNGRHFTRHVPSGTTTAVATAVPIAQASAPMRERAVPVSEDPSKQEYMY